MTQTPVATGAGTPDAGRTLWLYGYEITSPLHEHRAGTIRRIVARENRAAQWSAGDWTARLVLAQQSARVLIVSTRPDLRSERDRHLQAELAGLGVEFTMTVPMPVRTGAEPGAS